VLILRPHSKKNKQFATTPNNTMQDETWKLARGCHTPRKNQQNKKTHNDKKHEKTLVDVIIQQKSTKQKSQI